VNDLITFFKPGIRAERAMNILVIFSLLFLSAIMWSSVWEEFLSLLRGFLLFPSVCFELSPTCFHVVFFEVESSNDRTQDFGFWGEACCVRLGMSKPVFSSNKDEKLLFLHDSSAGTLELSPLNSSPTEFMSKSLRICQSLSSCKNNKREQFLGTKVVY